MKKILAIAIATAFAAPAPAFAATANVDIYGDMHLSLELLDNGDEKGTNVSTNASRIGFKGAEDLGGGLNAIWQVETLINGDGAGAGSTFNSQRDTFVGLKGGFGTVRLGYFNTPTKQLSRKLDLFNNRIGDTRSLLRSNAAQGSNSYINALGNTVTGAGSNAWEERFSNGVRYDTPTFFGGLSFSAHYSTQMDRKAAADNSSDAYSVGAEYKNGPLFVGATYQENNLRDTVAPITNLKPESNVRLGAGFNMGDLKLVALYSRSEDQRGVDSADRDVWGAGAAYKLGNGEFKAQFYKATEDDSLDDSGAKMYAVGYDYNLSKRTLAYVAYAMTDNDSNAAFSAMAGAHGDNLNIAIGEEAEAVAIGVIHKF